jgi:hypothetical protein
MSMLRPLGHDPQAAQSFREGNALIRYDITRKESFAILPGDLGLHVSRRRLPASFEYGALNLGRRRTLHTRQTKI